LRENVFSGSKASNPEKKNFQEQKNTVGLFSCKYILNKTEPTNPVKVCRENF
jgi:hypothetical protein